MAGAAVLRALRTPLSRSLSRSLAATSCSGSAPVESLRPPAPRGWAPPWSCGCTRLLQLSCGLRAGHNKWSKVKHIKGPRDAARGRMIMKLSLMIKIAVKEGGSNPATNVNLAHLLERCRNHNLPKASVEAAIKNAEKAKPLSQHMFEARGPGGCLLLIEVLTDNNTRCHQEVKRILTKSGGALSEGVRHSFTRKGVVGAVGDTISAERALELAIEAGAEDVQETEDEEEQPVLKFVCDSVDLGKVRSSLEKLGMSVTSSELEFLPSTTASLDPEQLEAASSLVEALSDFPDVVRVWDNIQAGS